MSPERIEWSYNPWRERPARAALGCLGASLLCLLALSLRLPAVMALALSVAGIAPLAVVFLPVRLRLDEAGATRRVGPLAETRPWRRIRRAVRGPRGVLLTPFRSRSWLDAYGGLLLPMPRREGPAAEELDRILARHGL